MLAYFWGCVKMVTSRKQSTQHKPNEGNTMNVHTRTVNLWLANDEFLYGEVMDALKENSNVYDFGIKVRKIVEDWLFTPIKDAFTADVLQSSLCEVNWAEISDDYWSEYKGE